MKKIFNFGKDKTVETVSKPSIREEITNQLKKEGLIFFELNSRMNYGLIGNIIQKKNKINIQIFEECFYIKDDHGEFPLNKKNLKLISDIQKEYLTLTRDKDGYIIYEKDGIGDIDNLNQ